MGWPLAVSRRADGAADGGLSWRALVALAAGHLIAMVAILMPFAVMTLLIDWQREIRIAAGVLVIALGF